MSSSVPSFTENFYILPVILKRDLFLCIFQGRIDNGLTDSQADVVKQMRMKMLS